MKVVMTWYMDVRSSDADAVTSAFRTWIAQRSADDLPILDGVVEHDVERGVVAVTGDVTDSDEDVTETLASLQFALGGEEVYRTDQ